MLLTLFTVVISATAVDLSFPVRRLRDDPFPRHAGDGSGGKMFLKNRLLDNLNSFFGAENGEALEILDAEPSQRTIDLEVPDVEPLSAPKAIIRNNQVDDNTPIVHRFPTLIPSEETTSITTTPRVAARTFSTSTISSRTSIESVKIRKEGSSSDTVDPIREWRRRLYKAFKGSRKKYTIKPTLPPALEILSVNDSMPAVVDKNHQILLSRKEPSWHRVEKKETFVKDPAGKLVPLFGVQAAGFNERMESRRGAAPPPVADLVPMNSNHMATRDNRGTYRQHVVYLPAPPAPPYIPPATVHLVTATAPYPSPPPPPPPPPPQPIQNQYRTLPPLLVPPNTPIQLLQEFQTTLAPFNSFPAPQRFNQNQEQMQTIDVEEMGVNDEDEMEEDQTEMFGPPMSMNRDGCQQNCPEMQNGVIISDEKCNSNRLRTIIQNNIVPNDAEASKRAVQMAAESETGLFFDAVCGTGFFSYIAHTDEFCLASSNGVNCYIFSPVCGSNESEQFIFGKRRRSMAKREVCTGTQRIHGHTDFNYRICHVRF